MRGTESASCSRVPTPRVFELVAWCRLSTFIILPATPFDILEACRLHAGVVSSETEGHARSSVADAHSTPRTRCARRPPRERRVRDSRPRLAGAPVAGRRPREARSTARELPGAASASWSSRRRATSRDCVTCSTRPTGAAWARAASWMRRRAPSWARRSEPPRSEPRTPDKTRRCVCCSSEARIWVWGTETEGASPWKPRREATPPSSRCSSRWAARLPRRRTGTGARVFWRRRRRATWSASASR